MVNLKHILLEVKKSLSNVSGANLWPRVDLTEKLTHPMQKKNDWHFMEF